MRILTALTLVFCSNVLAQVAVVEPSVRAVLADGKTTISLAVNNRLPQPVDVRVALQWLDPDGRVDGKSQRDVTLVPGESAVAIAHPLCGKCEPLLERLEYLIIPTSGNYNAFAPISGILSLPNIAAHAFALSVLTAGFPAPNQPFEMRVLAAHPLTGQPVPGVRVTSGSASALTGADGIALLRVRRAPDEEDSIEVEAQLGDFRAAAESTPLTNKKPTIRGYTDKPIYQPGQTMRIRVLALDAGGRAQDGHDFELRVVDESDELKFGAAIKTSRFGIASADWEIPPYVGPGVYRIQVKTDETDRYFLREVNIRRYELPSFRLNVVPDRPFYLIGQRAEIEVRGEYLFGKPVSSGKVRVVTAEGDDEEVIAEGSLDNQGRFRATLPATVNISGNYRFEDHHYIAFLTDLSTNRTEQRKFDIRISRELIHIYPISLDRSGAGRRLYVSTYSPDGTPLRTQVEVANSATVVGRGATNRFGVARIELPALKGDESLEIHAIAAGGRRVRMELSSGALPFQTEAAAAWITTDRSLYRSGQPVKCVIGTVKAVPSAVLVAFNDNFDVLFTSSVRLHEGRATVEIPYDKRFGRTLNVGVATPFSKGALPTRRVYFPGPGELQFKAAPARPTYRPGDTATIQFEASEQAALGIAIVDQSVLERATTDSAFGRRGWFAEHNAADRNVGGIIEADLLNLDTSRIDDPDLQLVAEVLSANAGYLINNASDFADDIRTAFEKQTSTALAPVVSAIDKHYVETLEFPRDDASLGGIAGHPLSRVQDPWLRPYYVTFSIDGPHYVVTFLSGGPDKLRGTGDDFEAITLRRRWFAPQEALMREALKPSADYPESPAALANVVNSIGLRFETLLDPWGTPVRAEVRHQLKFRNIALISAGRDRVFATADDFVVAEFRGTYFSAVAARINRALQSENEFPFTPDNFRAVLARHGIEFDSLRDPWGHAYHLSFRDFESFTDQVEIYTYAEYNRAPEERKQITPLKRTIHVVEVRSPGEDGVKGTYDDFAVAIFTRAADRPQTPVVPRKPQSPSVTVGGTGMIAGIVIDASGAVLPNAEVKLDDTYIARSDGEGRFAFGSLPPGTYRLSCSMPGFQLHVLERIPVTDGRVTRVQVTLQVGAVTETVSVAAEMFPLQTQSASIAAQVETAMSTPRVRSYFPETLYWQPELVTDKTGRASVRVQLADSVTSWHVSAIASTVDGRIAEMTAQVRAFQPFIADLDVPQSLTAGDEIALPVPVRNYTDSAQKVALSAKLAPELRLVTPVRQPDVVPSSSSRHAIVSIRAETPAKKAAIRVTATGGSASDAVEKSAVIRPDGELRTSVVGSVVAAGESLPIAVAMNAIRGSIAGDVKIYPSLLARIMEAIEVLLQAPHGCGEQTISTAYPSLLLLQAMQQTGLADDRLSARALRYLNLGYQRLLGYQTADGGFAYWRRSEPDVAVTAYALTFFNDAAAFIDIDEEVLARARRWLERQTAAPPATLALRAQALAGTADIDRALGDLARKAAEYGDPYALAAYALAAIKAGQTDLAGPAIDQLRRKAQDERGAAWWALRANTPFHGWGRWGQVETTAMAVTALARWRKAGNGDASLDKVIDRGALFLLRNTGHGGAWATSQSTVRALMALLEVWGRDEAATVAQIEVIVNGSSAGKVNVHSGRELRAPVSVDISHLLHAGENRISLAGLESRAQQVHLSASWSEPWGPKRADKDLDMNIRYSTLDASINESIACDVVISRPAFRGYGMMIAKVGLPPGAEVDRGILEQIIGEPGNGVDAYEVAPDHVTFYVWPRAADVKFRFLFRPRFAMKARAAGSVLYDFYNPDSNVALAPEIFVIRP